MQGQKLTCQGPLIGFGKHGESGQVITDCLPWHGKMADDICILRSMVTEQINHDPAHTFMNTGTANIVHVRDLHATMRHLLGIDHERFSVKHQGLDSRLTGVEKARVLTDVLL